MNTWEELRNVLLQLEAERPIPLRLWPTTSVEDRPPPFFIFLSAWAVDVAADLHARFGDEVILQVGHLHYPSRTLRRADGSVFALPPPPHAPLLSPEEVELTLLQPVEVRSGYDLTTELIIKNKGLPDLHIHGTLMARVIDPHTLAVVGQFAGPQEAPLKIFTVERGRELAVPLLIGTASLEASLGYAIPPGEWAIDAILPLGKDGMRRTPPLPLTVTV